MNHYEMKISFFAKDGQTATEIAKKVVDDLRGARYILPGLGFEKTLDTFRESQLTELELVTVHRSNLRL